MVENVTVMVVEDEGLLRLELEHVFQEGGYAVVSASDGERAISMLELARPEVRALVTDINLGSGKTGWDVARRARELKPELPIIYVSSVATAEWAAKGVPKSVLIGKPFAPAQLITAVSQLLNAVESTDGS